MSLTKKRWLILIFSCLINLCIGSIYAWSVFASPMAKYLSTFSGKVITPGDLAIVFSIANAVGPVTMISGGFFNDKLGPRTVIFVGGLMFGGGMLLSGFAKNITMLIVSYGLLAGLGLGMTYGCTISNSVKFFPDHRGLIGGLTTAAYGISSVLVSPIANALNNSVGVASSFKIFGIVFGVVVCVGAFFTQKCPVGFVPQGWTPPVRKNVSAVSRNRDWKEMLVSPISLCDDRNADLRCDLWHDVYFAGFFCRAEPDRHVHCCCHDGGFDTRIVQCGGTHLCRYDF